MQRRRLVDAAVGGVDELGWTDVTVADIAARARVSRRTFYDLFENREDCLLAMLEEVVARVRLEFHSSAGLEGSAWVERVRTGLGTILGFLDRDPALARVCVVQSARGTQDVLEAREDVLARLASVIGEGAAQGSRAERVPPLTAEGLVGAAVAIVYKRLLQGERTPLSDLQGELMGMIVLPYLGSAAASRERRRGAGRPSADRAGVPGKTVSVRRKDPLSEVPMRVTYRTARVLQAAAQHPGLSNRRVADVAGIADQGQVSKLLARLQRLGLLTNSGEGHTRGERNAWRLTPLGVRVTEQLNLNTHTTEATTT